MNCKVMTIEHIQSMVSLMLGRCMSINFLLLFLFSTTPQLALLVLNCPLKMFTLHSAYLRIGIAGALLTLPVDVKAVPATRTVTLFDIQFPSVSLDTPEPPSTPTALYSYSVLGTTTNDGNTMTVYGEDIIYSEYIEGGIISEGGTTSTLWATGTYSTPQTLHYVLALGATAIELSHSDASEYDPAFVLDCNFDGPGESSGTGACTEAYRFVDHSTSWTTSWTGSVIPIATFSVSVPDTATSTSTSATNAAESLKRGQWTGLLAEMVYNKGCVKAVYLYPNKGDFVKVDFSNPVGPLRGYIPDLLAN
ncbi:hypothetical protein J3R30DRAFT_3423993 [Lentinula aciculospora]|uniref:Uncharacterized protein n=1 Tax=Lentinula aciculospora TaxID=153920 RepID=A0A9W9AU88_9AGAR|nr:hypothetical protein J3R30DRAFT_3423993 [Lentinula aciculospora]